MRSQTHAETSVAPHFNGRSFTINHQSPAEEGVPGFLAGGKILPKSQDDGIELKARGRRISLRLPMGVQFQYDHLSASRLKPILVDRLAGRGLWEEILSTETTAVLKHDTSDARPPTDGDECA
ncbi:hypothetical protein NOR_00357 [Metarhizium rileyi]|uniref:Uncharacterized protein n=1 Tax=Metarhizium rileyi (strain RCEF 4871) TaxID=1649241 RepID=A0A167KI40_METRR|nr:hypothetical protein NOR_00357 [Metarhizium rileyi RCEF 4871]